MNDQSINDKKQSALLKILRRLTPASAKLVYYSSALGAIALAGGVDLPPELTVIAGGLGVNILSAIIDRIARGEHLSDEKLQRLIEYAVKRSDIETLLTKQDFVAGYGRLVRHIDVVRIAIREGDTEIVQILMEQFGQHREILIEFNSYLVSIREEQINAAVRDEHIINSLQEILHKYSHTIPEEVGIEIATESWKEYLEKVVNNPEYNRWAGRRTGEGNYIDETLLPITVHEYDLQIGGRIRKGKRGSLVDIGLNPEQKNLLILGDPGTGKTTGLETTMYEQALETLNEMRNGSQTIFRIPVFISLREYSGSLTQLLFKTLRRIGIIIERENQITPLLSSRAQSLLIMFDGLNEVAQTADNTDDLPAKIATEIRDITTEPNYQHHRFIVTCRVRDYKAPLSRISWDGYGIEELTPEDIKHYLVERLKPDQDGLEIYNSLSIHMKELVKNPQLLFMLSEILLAGSIHQINNRGQLYHNFIAERLRLDDDKLPSKYTRRDKRLVLATIGFWHYYETGGPGTFSDSKLRSWLKTKLDETELDFDISDRTLWRREIFNELISNVLLKMTEEEPRERIFTFYHQSYEEFGAADYLFYLFEGDTALKNAPDLDINHLNTLTKNDKWAEPLVLLSGILGDTSTFLRAILEVNPLLAGRCLMEGQAPNTPDVIGETIAALLNIFDTSDDALTAELLYKIKKAYPLIYLSLLNQKYPESIQRTKIDARIHKNAGRRLQQTGNWETARLLYREAKEIIEANNQTGGLDCVLALAISDNADLDDVEGKDYTKTQDAHETALFLINNSNNPCEQIETAEIYKRYGINLRYQERWEQALSNFHTTLELTKTINSIRGKSVRGEALMGIGKIYLEQDKFGEALAHYQHAKGLFEEIQDSFNLAQVTRKIGEAYMGLGSVANNHDPLRVDYLINAQKQMELSLKLTRERGDLFGIGISLDQLGTLFEIQANFEQTKMYQRQSLDTKEVLKGDKRGFIRSYCGLARAYAATEDIQMALRALERAKEYLVQILDWEMYGEYHRSKGFVISRAVEQGVMSFESTVIALEHFEQARQIWQQTNRPCRQMKVNEEIDKIRMQNIQRSLRFCTRCGKELEITHTWLSDNLYDTCNQDITLKTRLHVMCVHCGNVSFMNPKIGVAVIIETQDGVILAQRKEDPHSKKWTIVAGYTEYDETLPQAAIREAFEETGVDLRLDLDPLGIYTFRDDPRADMVLIVYTGNMLSGQLNPGDDVIDLRDFSYDNILIERNIAFEGNRQALLDWLKKKYPEIADLKKKIWSFFMLYDTTPSLSAS
jgi:ADP-ribose pyrophosphatase YjhB (NUDIX family)/tetratricopeptide (TPR) repeat protein